MALYADVFIDMNTADGNGTTLTPTILANGTIGTYTSPWICVPATPTGLTIAATSSNRKRYDEVVVGSTRYPTNHVSRPIALLHTAANFTYGEIDFVSQPFAIMTIAGFVTFGPSNAGVSGNLYDVWRIDDALGDFAVMQLVNGNGPVGTGYNINIETNPLGATTHSAYTQITPGATYWCSLHVDYIAGTAHLMMWDLNQVKVVDVTAVVQKQTGINANVNGIRIGNGEVGTDAGTTTFFENMIIDYTFARDPLGPIGPQVAQSIRQGNRLRRRFIAQLD